LESIKPSGEKILSSLIEETAHFSKKRSLVILISDLLEDQDSVIRALKLLKFKKHEVCVIHLLDLDEKEFPYTGSVQFSSMENDEKLIMDTESFRDDYQEEIRKFIEDYRRTLRTSGIEYSLHTTNEPPDRLLQQFLSQR
jgi:uncharacterized protein (DUF58 family)